MSSTLIARCVAAYENRENFDNDLTMWLQDAIVTHIETGADLSVLLGLKGEGTHGRTARQRYLERRRDAFLLAAWRESGSPSTRKEWTALSKRIRNFLGNTFPTWERLPLHATPFQRYVFLAEKSTKIPAGKKQLRQIILAEAVRLSAGDRISLIVGRNGNE